MSPSWLSDLQSRFPNLEFQPEFPLAPITTVKIGGPAEVFVETPDYETFRDVVQHARQQAIPVTIIGWGANTLIADRGVRGLVIKNKAQAVTVLSEDELANSPKPIGKISPRLNSHQHTGSSHEFSELDYEESSSPEVLVRIDSGTPLPLAINNLLNQGITGLQWFSRIPATIGGGVVNNIHGGSHFFSEYVTRVEVIDNSGNITTLLADQLEFDYDFSRFHNSREIITWVEMKLFRGDVDRAKQVVSKWAELKSHQPAKSLGCIFQNLSEAEKEQHHLPTSSVGYIVDQILHKKGYRLGDAQISDYHAAFIENVGQASASDYIQLIREIIQETQAKLGIKLKPEIFFLGFTQDELSDIV